MAHVSSSPGGAVRVRLEGELDLATVPELKTILYEQLAAGNDVVLDLSTLEFIDSSGLQVIITSLRAADELPGTLAIHASMPSQVHRLLEIAGLLSSLPLVDD
jgi:anti-anti-sigma factor